MSGGWKRNYKYTLRFFEFWRQKALINTTCNSTNSSSTIGNKLIVSYQISINHNLINPNSTTGSKLIVKYQTSINTSSINYTSTIGSKLIVN